MALQLGLAFSFVLFFATFPVVTLFVEGRLDPVWPPSAHCVSGFTFEAETFQHALITHGLLPIRINAVPMGLN